MKLLDMYKRADQLEDGPYRYELTRAWGLEMPGRTRWLVYLMLNPSTANGTKDDPTIRKCVGFAQRHDYHALRVVNLYAYRATDPNDLYKAVKSMGWQAAQGPGNDSVIRDRCRGADVVLAWGGEGRRYTWRIERVMDLLKRVDARLFRLGALTKSGQPAHPLMLPYATPLFKVCS